MANQLSLKEDEMLAEKVKHFPVLYGKQVKGYSATLNLHFEVFEQVQVLHAFWRYFLPKTTFGTF